MHFPCGENKCADQLRDYREADLRLCFRICKKPVFSRRGSNSWDPYLKYDINKIERMQRKVARFITGDHKMREEGFGFGFKSGICLLIAPVPVHCFSIAFVTRMLETLELSSLEQRRSINRLVFMYKVVEGLVPAIPADDFLKPQK